MAVTFDPAKREKTLRERHLDFLDAEAVFEGPTYDAEDDRQITARRASSRSASCRGEW